MVLIETESTQYTTNRSFGVTINKFQDCNKKKKKNHKDSWKKKKKNLQNNKHSILSNQTCLNIYILLTKKKKKKKGYFSINFGKVAKHLTSNGNEIGFELIQQPEAKL